MRITPDGTVLPPLSRGVQSLNRVNSKVYSGRPSDFHVPGHARACKTDQSDGG